MKDPQADTVAPAILQTQLWSENNRMTLNASKTVVMNIILNYRHKYEDPVLVDGYSISPSNAVKFLGVYIDNHLNFSANVDNIISRTNSRLFLLRQLKILGMNTNGLITFYCTNIRSVLTYAAPAWYTLLSKFDQERLEKVQRCATRVILPDLEYPKRLDVLDLPTLHIFIHNLSQRLFSKIASDVTHPLNSRILVNSNRTSSRKTTKYYTKASRTTKRAKSFFPFFMSLRS